MPAPSSARTWLPASAVRSSTSTAASTPPQWARWKTDPAPVYVSTEPRLLAGFMFLRSGSAGRNCHAAIGHDHRAHHEARPLRGEKGDDLGDLLRLRRAPDGCGFAMLGKKARAVLDHVVEDVG